jgi:hypothetical protein
LEAWSRGEERRYLICGLWVCGSGWPETTDADDAQEYFTAASFLLLLLLHPLLQTPTNTPQVAGADLINPRCEQWRGHTGCKLRMRGAEMEQGSRRQPSSGGRRVEGGSRRSSRDGAGRRRECGVRTADTVSVLPKCQGFHRKVNGLSSGRGLWAVGLWRLGLCFTASLCEAKL